MIHCSDGDDDHRVCTSSSMHVRTYVSTWKWSRIARRHDFDLSQVGFLNTLYYLVQKL